MVKERLGGMSISNQVMSVAEYATHRGCVERTVYRAIEQGRCPTLPGPGRRIPVARADREWPVRGRHRSAMTVPVDAPISSESGAGEVVEEITLHEAKTRKEVAAAQLAELKLAKERGDLLDLESIERIWYETLRRLRNRLQAIPNRVAATLAVETDVRAVRRVLSEQIEEALRAVAEKVPTG